MRTPGRWYVLEEDPVVIYSRINGEEDRFVAMTLPDTSLGRDGTQEHYDNALLIAAAPDLLIALEDLAGAALLAHKAQYDKMLLPTLLGAGFYAKIKAACEAIDKVEGR